MTINEVRQKYLDFMKSKGHAIVPSGSLVPEGDPTTLFTGSGMQPMLPYLLGAPHPAGVRVADSQKCFRAEDIEEVGDNRHTTFFEMLGNWSFGDAESTDGRGYFKKEQLQWVSDLLFDELKINPHKVYTTCFIGDPDNGLPKDLESAELWQEIFAKRGVRGVDIADIGSELDGYQRGMKAGERIFYYDARKNWWSRAGVPSNMPVGEPGGPDSEIFYLFDEIEHDSKFGAHCHPNCDCGRFLEIGNSVFMTYVKVAESNFDVLPKKNIDFGGGLERITAAANNDPDIFNVDVFARCSINDRRILDHMRAAVMLLGDAVLPSNTQQGYLLRRLIRRAVMRTRELGVESNQLSLAVAYFIDHYDGIYPKLGEKASEIHKAIHEEIETFEKTLDKGLREFEKGERDAFKLFTTYGFPLEMTKELVEEKGEEIDLTIYRAKMDEHRRLSRSGSEQKFKGGLADTSEMSVKYHTATHLLHQALRDVLGEHVLQKGSNITPERLRFDFSHGEKMTDEEKSRVEDIVNAQIKKSLPVSYQDISLEEAQEMAAIGVFEETYETKDKVRVYSVGEGKDRFSLEFCGGPHVENTSKLGEGGAQFRIKKEEAVAKGIRRIKAVLE